MQSEFEYIRAESLYDALDFLARHGADATVVAGGTDLTVAIRRGEVASRFVLDISRLEETRDIDLENGHLQIGATATFAEIIASPLVQEHAPVLAAACRCIGSVQIRNVGTLGGNLVNASPAADGVPPLVAHNATVLVRSSASDRVIPVTEFITGPYRTGLRPGELVTGVQLECTPGEYRHSFQRIARRRALAIARINVATVGSLDARGTVADVRIAPGSVTPTPCRMKSAEQRLVGRTPEPEILNEAVKEVSREMIAQTGVRPSTEYKKPALEGLVLRALTDLFS